MKTEEKIQKNKQLKKLKLKKLKLKKEDLIDSIADCRYKGWMSDECMHINELDIVLDKIAKLTNKPKIKPRIPIYTKV